MSTVNVNRVVDASGGVLAPISSVMRNRIINGAMVIDQRNAGASVTNTASTSLYGVDRWNIGGSQASKYTAQQSTVAPAGFFNSYLITSTSAYTLGASDFFFLRQNIEAFNVSDLSYGTADSKTVTLSFWVRSSLTGTFGGALRNAANNYSYPFTYTINSANTWEYETITIVGAPAGTWNTTGNGTGIELLISLGIGSTFSGTAGSWSANNFGSATGAVSVVGTNGATFYITGVQLEVGTQATSYEYENYGVTLQKCQRYYEVTTYDASTYALMSAALNMFTNQWHMFNYKVTKRASPTFGIVTGSWTNTPAINPSIDKCSFNGASVFYLTGVNGQPAGSFSAEL